MLLTLEKPSATGAYSVIPYNEGIESNYKFVSTFGDTVNMSRRAGNSLHIPRETAELGTFDHRVSKTPIAINCNFTPINEEQQPLTEKSIALLLAGHNHVFEAPTGWGKSVAGAYIAARVGQPTLIVVTKSDLMDSWYDALVNVLGIPPSAIGKIQQDTVIWKGKQFVIGMVQSLIIEDKYPDEMYQYFGMMVLDEVHLMAADCFVNVCWKVPARYRLGFSATPKRSDGKWVLVEAHVGTTQVRGSLVPMKPKVLVQKTGWKPPPGIPMSAGRLMTVYGAMAKSTKRNQIIVEFTTSAYERERRTLILSDLTDHLEKVFFALTASGIPGNDIGYYVGGKSKAELDIAKNKRIVLGTYKMCSTGTNVPQWDTLCMATPRADIKQSIGRVMRYVEHKKTPVILDMVDDNKLLNGYFLSRLKQYYSVGAEVKQV